VFHSDSRPNRHRPGGDLVGRAARSAGAPSAPERSAGWATGAVGADGPQPCRCLRLVSPVASVRGSSPTRARVDQVHERPWPSAAVAPGCQSVRHPDCPEGSELLHNKRSQERQVLRARFRIDTHYTDPAGCAPASRAHTLGSRRTSMTDFEIALQHHHRSNAARAAGTRALVCKFWARRPATSVCGCELIAVSVAVRLAQFRLFTAPYSPVVAGVECWAQSVAQAGLPGFHFHDLRHIGNTLAAGTGQAWPTSWLAWDTAQPALRCSTNTSSHSSTR
jgi:hypothetical protein